MISGFNTNVKRRGQVFHIQTEEKGPSNPVVVSLVYFGGQIVGSVEVPYLPGEDAVDPTEDEIRRRMREQHQSLIREIRTGKFDPGPMPYGHDIVSGRSLDELVLDDLENAIDEVVAQEAPRHSPTEDLRPTRGVEVAQALHRLERFLDSAERASSVEQRKLPTPDTMPLRPSPPRVRRRRRTMAAAILAGVAVGVALWLFRPAPAPPPRPIEPIARPAVVASEPSPGPDLAATETDPVAKPVETRLTETDVVAGPVETRPTETDVVAGPVADHPTATGPAEARPTERGSPLLPAATGTPPLANSASPTRTDAAKAAPPAPAVNEAVSDIPEAPSAIPPPSESIDAAAPPAVRRGELVDLAAVDVAPQARSGELPRYTARARRKQQQGVVEVSLLIDEHGKVADAALTRDDAGPDLARQTLEAVRKWTFSPARKDRQPVKVSKELAIEFTIGPDRSTSVRIRE